MTNQELLTQLRDELTAIEDPYANWSKVESWIAKANAVLAVRFKGAVANFDELTDVAWVPAPPFMTNTPAREVEATIDGPNRSTATNAVNGTIAFLEGLMLVSDP